MKIILIPKILDSKRYSNPITGLDRSLGFPEVEAARFQDSQHMKVIRLSALCTGYLYSPGNIPGIPRLSQPKGHSAAGRIMSLKNSCDTLGNQTHNLPACSAVPQPTVPPHTPLILDSNSSKYICCFEPHFSDFC
jgi:hypothetical protein